jgi:hypothetical protein
MPSLTQPDARVFTVVTKTGLTAQAVSAHWAMDRLILNRYFSKLTQYDYKGWAVLEWECALKHPEDGAREGAQFIKDHIIRVTERAFDDFAASGSDDAFNRKTLGI